MLIIVAELTIEFDKRSKNKKKRKENIKESFITIKIMSRQNMTYQWTTTIYNIRSFRLMLSVS